MKYLNLQCNVGDEHLSAGHLTNTMVRQFFKPSLCIAVELELVCSRSETQRITNNLVRN